MEILYFSVIVLLSINIIDVATEVVVQHGVQKSHVDCLDVREALLKLQARVDRLEVDNEAQRRENLELKKQLPKESNSDNKPKIENQKGGENMDKDTSFKEMTNGNHDKSHRRIRQAGPGMNVAFFARLQNHMHHLGQNQNIIFEDEVTNIGNAYNPHLGVFIAPVAGTYSFSTTLLTYGRNTTHYGFSWNGNTQTVMFIDGKENAGDSVSQTIVLHLNKGDDVSVRHTNSDMHGLYGNHHSIFSGFLLPSIQTGDEVIG